MIKEMNAVCAEVRAKVGCWHFRDAVQVKGYQEIHGSIRDIVSALAACYDNQLNRSIFSNTGIIVSCAVDKADRMLHNIEMGRDVDAPDPA